MSYIGRFWSKTIFLVFVLSSLVLLFCFIEREKWEVADLKHAIRKKITNTWAYLVQFYKITIGRTFTITETHFLFPVSISFSLFSLVVFIVKIVLTILYTYKMIKKFYGTFRERNMKTKMDLEDIQLQIQIVNTKLSVICANVQFKGRAELQKREAGQFLALQAHVRSLITTDGTLKSMHGRAAPCLDNPVLGNSASDEGGKYIIEVMKPVNKDQVPASDGQNLKLDCGEQLPTEVPTEESSIYSSLSDDVKPECTVKIIRVTNVYRVSYLKHNIREKRFRRASGHALLKKQTEAIKTLLEDWQKSLNRVLNTKLPISQTMNIDRESEEAMGDHSKPNSREFSDSDTDLRANGTNLDELNFNWTQNPYRPYQYEGLQEISLYKPEYSESSKYAAPHLCECNTRLFILPEETSSQVAIEEFKSEHESDYETDARDDKSI